MPSDEYSTRKEQVARAFRAFIDAHARGMKSLKDGDVRGLQDAITDECAAVDSAAAAINAVLHPPDSPDASQGSGGSDPSLEAEHARLFAHMQELEREHRELEARGHDIEAHRQHRTRLRAHIAELKEHLERLRAHYRSDAT